MQVSVLLKLGADVNKKSFEGETALRFAIEKSDLQTTKLLLKNNVKINEVLDIGDTALHYACRIGDEDMIRMLLDYGADLNVLDGDGETCFTQEDLMLFEDKVRVVKELALLRFENQPIGKQNLDYLEKKKDLLEVFEACLEELKKMKNLKIYNSFSIYDILKMRKNYKKLILMTKNKDFVKAFNHCRNKESFEYYGYCVNDLFEESLEKGSILKTEEECLYSIFKDYLPAIVIRNIAYMANENLFLE